MTIYVISLGLIFAGAVLAALLARWLEWIFSKWGAT